MTTNLILASNRKSSRRDIIVLSLRAFWFLYLGLIWFVSSLPGDSLPSINEANIDKLFHFTEYFLLSFLGMLNYKNGMFKSFQLDDFLMLIVILAGLDEAHQLFIDNRSVSLFDVSANISGCIIAYFVMKGKK